MNLKPLLLCLAIGSPSVFADVKYGDYVAAGRSNPVVVGYMTGLTSGVLLANEAVLVATGRDLFCLPEGIVITLDSAYSLVEGEAQKVEQSSRNDLHVPLLLMKGVKSVYACQSGDGAPTRK